MYAGMVESERKESTAVLNASWVELGIRGDCIHSYVYTIYLLIHATDECGQK